MKDLIEELRQRQAVSLEHGGTERMARQHNQGKLTARERVDLLFDADTLEEIGQLATHVHTPVTTIPNKHTPADGVIAGFGRIDGRPAAVVAEEMCKLRWGCTSDTYRKEHLKEWDEQPPGVK